MSDMNAPSLGALIPMTADPTSSPALETYQDQARKNVELRRAEIALCLCLAGVTRVEIRYDGCGDSGQIEEVIYWDEHEQPIVSNRGGKIEQALIDLCYDLLEARHPGWEIDDGAFGEFYWNLRTDTLSHTHNSRFTDYETTEHEGL